MRRGAGRRGEEDPGTLGPRVENENKVNMKDETGTGERAEFRSRGEGGEGRSETEEVDGEIKEKEIHSKWGVH